MMAVPIPCSLLGVSIGHILTAFNLNPFAKTFNVLLYARKFTAGIL